MLQTQHKEKPSDKVKAKNEEALVFPGHEPDTFFQGGRETGYLPLVPTPPRQTEKQQIRFPSQQTLPKQEQLKNNTTKRNHHSLLA